MYDPSIFFIDIKPYIISGTLRKIYYKSTTTGNVVEGRRPVSKVLDWSTCRGKGRGTHAQHMRSFWVLGIGEEGGDGHTLTTGETGHERQC